MATNGGVNENALSWDAACRWRQYDAERRINLFRIAAIGTMYGIHLWHHWTASGTHELFKFAQLDGERLSAPIHLAISLIALAWTALSFAIQAFLDHRVFPRKLAYYTTSVDVALLTATLVLTSGPTHPLVAGYFLIVMMAGLRIDLRLVRFATAACIAGYLVVLGCARWPSGLLVELKLPTIPRYQQIMMVAAIVLAGVIVGQWVRHATLLAQDLAGTGRSEKPK